MDKSQLEGLIDRYTKVLSAGNESNVQWVNNLNGLRLAHAACTKAELIQQYPEHPLQVLVLGPTQAGKSTLANLILDSNLAGISALAGFTVHAQGFASHCSDAELVTIEAALAPMQRISLSELNTEQLDCFVLDGINAGAGAMIDKGVVWDSPDFDSIEALGYRHAVLQSAALSDIIILTVSKDKYADKSVWDMLALLAPLAKPMMICINKLDPADEQTVVSSFQQRHQQQMNKDAPEIIAIPFIKGLADSTMRPRVSDTTLATIQQSLQSLISTVDRAELADGARKLIAQHQHSWLEPIEQENLARADWQSVISTAISKAEQFYQQTYLDDPNKNDTFNRAIAELLNLLEIPGLANTLSKARDVVTWPARKLFGLGNSIRQGGAEYNALEFEKDVLERSLQQLQNELQGHALLAQQEQSENAVFWQVVSQSLRECKTTTANEYDNAIETYQTRFAPQIDDAAKRLYSRLEQQPALLNSLRAARATAEAATVALAVKSGGLAPADLLVAPAMLSVTTLLTESALGKYMDKVKKELRLEQQRMVRANLFDAVVARHLEKASTELNDDRLWGAL